MAFHFMDSTPDETDWMKILKTAVNIPAQISPSLPPPPPPPPPLPRPVSCNLSELGISPPTEAKEVLYSMAALMPIRIDRELLKMRPRRNVWISKEPQSVVARRRRRRIGERFRILQQLVPGSAKMDTASMLEEAIRYVKFLKEQVRKMETAATERWWGAMAFGGDVSNSMYQAPTGKGQLGLGVAQTLS